MNLNPRLEWYFNTCPQWIFDYWETAYYLQEHMRN